MPPVQVPQDRTLPPKYVLTMGISLPLEGGFSSYCGGFGHPPDGGTGCKRSPASKKENHPLQIIKIVIYHLFLCDTMMPYHDSDRIYSCSYPPRKDYIQTVVLFLYI